MTTLTDLELGSITEILKAIAHDVRLKILRTLLENGEKSVGELETLTGIGQPGLSQQLAILRKAELVETRREAKLVYYSLASDKMESTAELVCSLAGISTQAGRPPSMKNKRTNRQSVATFARII